MKFIGIDFGTSNSLAALSINNKTEFVKFSDGNISNPTILYFPSKSKKTYIGNQAIQQYISDVEDDLTGGRLMLSIKSLLPDAKFDHTTVVGHGRQKPEDLVAKVLFKLKELGENQFAQTFDGVALGRPVDFTELAVNRLEKAAKIAGFKEVIFWLEPVAAALGYELTLSKDELVCVIDIGGGTADICVIETSPNRSLSPDRLNDIKSVGGIYQAGDELNSQIMYHKLAQRFGAGSSYTSLDNKMSFPVHIIHKLSRWHRINLLRNKTDLSTISSILPTSNQPDDLIRLQSLIQNHYGFELFQAIDKSKRDLSTNSKAIVEFRSLGLSEDISINEFENIIEEVVNNIEQSILESLKKASIKPTDIDKVLLTGGTSQVPLINHSVINIFGAAKISRPGFFSSVATGLGHVASLHQ